MVNCTNPYVFNPDEFDLKVGTTYTFTIEGQNEFHTFTVEGLGIAVLVDGGTTKRLSYTFDQEGTFGLICVPHERLGMVGTITVVP